VEREDSFRELLIVGAIATKTQDCGADVFGEWPRSTTAKLFKRRHTPLTWLAPVVQQGCHHLETWAQAEREAWANLAWVGWVVLNSITITTTLMEVLKEGMMSVCFTRCDACRD
jgi:hypothetical protein